MPCVGPSPAEEMSQERHENRKLYGTYASSLDIATRVACELAQWVQLSQDDLSSLALKWIEVHETQDAEREAKEKAQLEQCRIRALALLKLTPEEKEALGLEP